MLLGEADPDETQNEAPSILEFLDWCEQWQLLENEVLFEGYIITKLRDDHRVSVEGIQLNSEAVSDNVKKNFVEAFRLADEFDIAKTTYRAWWD